jgi:hypothetical protein
MLPPGSFLDENRVVHDNAGNVLADYSGPCSTALAGAASSGSDPRRPFEEYVLAYVDENSYPMWTGVESSWNVPAHKPYISTDQAMYWSTRLVGGIKGTSSISFLEAGVSYGPWPGIDATTTPAGTGLVPGSYNAWARVQVDPTFTFFSTPVAVQPGASVFVFIRLVGFRQPNPPVEPPEVAIYDPYTYLLWNIELDVEGVSIGAFSVSTSSLGVVDWTVAEPAVMAIWNMPGTGVSTCGDAMPPDGQMNVGLFNFATAPATAPTSMTWGPASLGIVQYGDYFGTPGLNCPTWNPTNNVILSPPSYATLTWPTASTQASPLPPPIVPAVPRGILVGLALLLVLVGSRSLRRSRS